MTRTAVLRLCFYSLAQRRILKEEKEIKEIGLREEIKFGAFSNFPIFRSTENKRDPQKAKDIKCSRLKYVLVVVVIRPVIGRVYQRQSHNFLV